MIEPARITDMLIEFLRLNALDDVVTLQKKLETRFPDHETNVKYDTGTGVFTLIVNDVTLEVCPNTVPLLL